MIDITTVLNSIKTDDVSAFDAYFSENSLNVGDVLVGRFPILSILYLYNARKLIKKYQGDLLRSNGDYLLIFSENNELYLRFNKVAGRVMRLYSADDVVSPLEMLLILDKTSEVKKLYPQIVHTKKIKENLQSIYSIKYGLDINFDGDYVEIERRPMTKTERKKLLFAIIGAILAVAIIVGTPFVVNVFYPFIGIDTDGTENNGGNSENDSNDDTEENNGDTPEKTIEVSSFEQIDFESDNSYLLTDDLTLSYTESIIDTKCEIDGNEKKITVANFDGTTLFETFSGKIENVTFDFSNVDFTINKAKGLFCNVNEGTISNVKFLINGKIKTVVPTETSDVPVANDDVLFNYYSLLYKNYTSFAVVSFINNGLIDGCSVENTLALSGETSANSSYAGFSMINNATINACAISGTINSNTVDLSGIVNYNRYLVKGCVNQCKLSQSGSGESWSPIVAGIAQTNYSVSIFVNAQISDCTNNATLEATSSTDTLTEIKISGILFENLGGSVINCNNLGSISANGKVSNAIVAGIAVRNDYSITFGQIDSCVNNAKIEVSVAKGTIMVSAISAYNQSSTITKCTNDSKGDIVVSMTESTGENSYDINVSGITSNNYQGTVSYCDNKGKIIANCVNSNVYASGVVALSNGTVSYCKNFASVETAVSTSEKVDKNGCIYVGGVTSYNLGKVNQCYNDGAISAINSKNDVYIGGVVAYNYLILNNSVNKGAISVTSGGVVYVGGVSAINHTLETSSYLSQTYQCISESTLTINTTGDKVYVGGIVGCNLDVTINETSYSGIVQYCYSLNEYTITENANAFIGGVIGCTGKYGFDNNNRGNGSYYLYNNYYVENSHTPNGIGKLYSSAEDVYSDGGNLFTEKTQRDNILNNEIYKEIISLFETAN